MITKLTIAGILVIVLLSVSLVSAGTISNTKINSSGLNLTLWFVDSVNYDTIVNDVNYTFINSTSTLSVFNVTGDNYKLLSRTASINFTEDGYRNTSLSIGCLRVNVSKTIDFNNLIYSYDTGYAINTCSGSQDLVVNNIRSKFAYYYVYFNGAYIERDTSDDYLVTSGFWEFTDNDATHFNTQTKPSLVNAYLVFAQMMGLIVIIALIGGISWIVWKFTQGGFNVGFGNLSFWLMAGALALMLATVTILIIVYIISTTSNVLAG